MCVYFCAYVCICKDLNRFLFFVHVMLFVLSCRYLPGSLYISVYFIIFNFCIDVHVAIHLMMGIFVSLDIFIIKNSAIVSIFVKVLFCTGASISLGYIEEESLSLQVSAFLILIHTIKMSVRETVQICSHSNIA